MKQVLRKLRSKKGESLMESMVSILVFTLSSIMLYTMITAAANVNAEAKKADAASQAQMLVAERGEGAGTPSSVSFFLDFGAEGTQFLNAATVEVYGESDAFHAYYERESGGT